jgi:arylsulfatase
VVATSDAEFRAGFDRKITEWAVDFMHRSHEQGKPLRLTTAGPGSAPARSAS